MSKAIANPLEYYASQSLITDPREYAYMLEGLPTDILTLCEVVRGSILHTETASRLGVELTSERFSEIYTRMFI